MTTFGLTIALIAFLALRFGDSQAARRWRAHLRRSESTLHDPASLLVTLAITAVVTAGQYAATRLLTPRPKPIDRGKVDDIRIQGSEYGGMRPRVFGKVRLAGNIIWTTGIKTTVTVTRGRSAGKGGGRAPDENNYSYSTSLAILVCEGPINRYTKIWADDEVIMNADAGGSEIEAEHVANTRAGSAAITADANFSNGQKVTGMDGTGSLTFNAVDAYRGAGLYQLALYYNATSACTIQYSVNGGAAATVDLPASSSATAATIVTLSATLNAGATNAVRFFGASAVGVSIDRLQTQSAVDTVDLEDVTGLVEDGADYPLNQERNWSWWNRQVRAATGTGTATHTLAAGNLAGVRMYTGTATQEPDSVIVATLGSAHAPAYLDTAYVVFENYQLKDGRVPNFTFEVDEGTTALDQVVTKIYALVGEPASKLEVTDLAADFLQGYIIESRAPARSALEDLQLAYAFDIAEVDGKIRATKRGKAALYTIPYDDLRAHEWQEEMPAQDCIVTTAEELSLPRRVEVNYLDPANDYHTNTQGATRYAGNTVDTMTVNMPMVMTADRAKQLAETLLYEAHNQKRSLQLQLPPKYIKLAPNDVVKVQLRNALHEIQITHVQLSLTGGIIKATGVTTDASVYTQTATGSTGTGREEPLAPFPKNVKLAILDIPALRPEDYDIGYYVTGVGIGQGRWQGGVLYKQNYQTGSYDTVTTLPLEATMGVAATRLEQPAAGASFDKTNTVTVDLLQGTLSSITEAELLSSSSNMAVLGQELIQFQTATPETPAAPYAARYVLSNILRGQLGTDYLLSKRPVTAARWDVLVGGVTRGTSGAVTRASGGPAWTAGARSDESVPASEGPVTFTWPVPDTAERMVGILESTDAFTGDYIQLRYGWNRSAGAWGIYENGVNVSSAPMVSGNVKPGIRINRSGLVEYLDDAGAVVYTSKAYANPRARYQPVASLHANGTSIGEATITRPSTPRQGRRPLTWQNMTKARLDSTGALTRYDNGATSSAWDGGASSLEVVDRGNAALEWAAGSVAGYYMVGLGGTDTTSGLADIAYAAYYFPGSFLHVYEFGAAVTVTSLGVPAAGDRLQWRLEGGGAVARLYHNDKMVYESARSPANLYPLRAHVSFFGDRDGLVLGGATLTTHDHSAGETFVLLDGAVKFRKEQPAELNSERIFKGVASGQDPQDVPATKTILQGNTVRAWAVANLGGSRDSAGNLHISFSRRLAQPDLAPGELFKVEVLGADGTVKDTLPVSPILSAAGTFIDDTTSGYTYASKGSIGTGNRSTIYAASAQTIDETNNFFEATVTAGYDATAGGATVRFGYMDARIDHKSYVTAPFYISAFGTSAGRCDIAVVLDGVGTLYSEANAVDGGRYRILFSGNETRVYRDYKGPGSVPLVISTAAVPFRVKAWGYAFRQFLGGAWSGAPTINSLIFSAGSTLRTVYSAAQQTAKFGATQSSIRVRVFEERAPAGRGFEVEADL